MSLTKVSLAFIFTAAVINVATSSKFSNPASLLGRSAKSSELNLDHEPETFEDAYQELRTFDSMHGGSEGGSGSLFSRKRLYNTSIALTASFFSYYLPPRTEPGAVTDLVNQAIYGLFGALAVTLIFGVPVLIAGVQETVATARSLTGFEKSEDATDESWLSSSLMNIDQVRRIFDEEYRDQIGLDRTKCLQKTICEAHRSPKNKRYGLAVLPFQMFYPPPEKGASEARASSYQEAAAEGKYRKGDCAKKYKCFFDTFDLFTFLIDWYRLSNDSEYEPSASDFN